MLEYSCREFIY